MTNNNRTTESLGVIGAIAICGAILIICVSYLRLQLHGAIHRPDSFVLMLRYCANLKAIRYESTSLNRIAADKSHRVIVALQIAEINRY